MPMKMGQHFLYIGLTYNAHPVGCAAAVATIAVYHEEQLIERAAALGNLIEPRLRALQEKFDFIGDVRGMGCFFCLDLVTDRATKEALPAAVMKTIGPQLLARGVSTNVVGNRLFIGPPMIITPAQIGDGLDVIEEVLAQLPIAV